MNKRAQHIAGSPLRSWVEKLIGTRRSFLALCALVVVLGVGGGLGLTRLWSERIYARIHHAIGLDAGAIVNHLEAHLWPTRIGARSLAEAPVVQRFMSGAAPELAPQVEEQLDRVQDQFGAQVSYLMDARGDTVDASNRGTETSFVGKNYGFRSYFQESVSGAPSASYALGVTSRKRGFYASHPVRGTDGVAGVAVLKHSLDPIEDQLFGQHTALLLNREGRVLMASAPELLFRVFEPSALPADSDDLPLFQRDLPSGSEVTWHAVPHLIERRRLGVSGPELVMLASLSDQRVALHAGRTITVLVTLVVLGVLVSSRGRVLQQDRERRAAVLIASKDRAYRMLFNEMSTGLALFEASEVGSVVGVERLVDINPAGEAILDRARDALVGSPLDEVLPGSAGQVREKLAILNEARTSQRFELTLPARDLILELQAFVPSHDRVALLIEDTTDRVRARQQLRTAKEAAEAADRAKSAFLANMSHEIRTPLTGVMGMVELLLLGELEPDQREKTLVVQNSAEALLTIINDILDLSKIESGSLVLEHVDFDLRREIGLTVELFSAWARGKGLAVRFHMDEALPSWVQGDPVRLKQVVSNLIGNAVKFTPEGEIRVTVGGKINDGKARIEIEVRDTGIGIESDKLEHIFDHFSQADTSTTRRFGGTGLGLSISMQLIELMGGSIQVESTPDVGSAFVACVTLPVAVEPQRAAPAPAETGPVSLGLHVLVAEDQRVNQRLANRMLVRLGCTVEIVADGRQAVERALRGGVDVILMDLQMPVLGGLEATQQLRAQGVASPIIAFTASAVKGTRETCLAAGMTGFVSKPLRLAGLREALQAIEV